MRKFWIWYKAQPVLLQLAIVFLTQWTYWLLAEILLASFWKDEKITNGSIIFTATWMAFFMTILFNFQKVKQLFKKKNDH